MSEKIDFGAIITDCSDPNAQARQEVRFAALFGVQPTFVGVNGTVPDLAAAGNLVDTLDAATNLPASAPEPSGVVLLNVAPRGEKKEGDDNGTPFCSFWLGKILVVSTLRGRGLELARGLDLIEDDTVDVFAIPDVTEQAVGWGELTQARAEAINDTQFRSLEFAPLVAKWLMEGRPVPSEKKKLDEAGNTANRAWFVDSFGNIKTSLLPAEVAFEEGKQLKLADGSGVTCYRRLADVPRGDSALVIGSSGFHEQRFLDFVVQKGNAAERHAIEVGNPILANL